MNDLHPMLRPSTLEYWLVVIPGTALAAAVLAAVSFVVELPWIG